MIMIIQAESLSFFSKEEIRYNYFSTPVKELISKFEISEQDLLPFMPLQNNELKKEDPLHVHYLGYYLSGIHKSVIILQSIKVDFKLSRTNYRDVF